VLPAPSPYHICCAAFGMGSCADVAWAEAYICTKWHLNPSSRLATIEMGRKLVGCAPFLGEGELGPNPAQCGLAGAYLRAKCHLDPSSCLATIKIGQKLLGEAVPLFGGS